jgi:hypothetical protein
MWFYIMRSFHGARGNFSAFLFVPLKLNLTKLNNVFQLILPLSVPLNRLKQFREAIENLIRPSPPSAAPSGASLPAATSGPRSSAADPAPGTSASSSPNVASFSSASAASESSGD